MENSKNLLDIMGCKYVPAIFTGNVQKDNVANTELYLKLLKEGDEKGVCPVLVEKDIKHYIYAPKYGFSDKPEDYPKVTQRLIKMVEDNCFSVWMGRLIYNFYLDCTEYEDDVQRDLEMLNPPTEKTYLEKFETKTQANQFLIGEDNSYKSYDFTYEDQVFVLLPIEKPWEALAWIPMGGFNWCPDELHQVALAKELYEQFGARIMYISFTSLEYYVPDPLVRKEDIEKAAKILIAADNDVYEDFEVAVDRIAGKHIWHMWWD